MDKMKENINETWNEVESEKSSMHITTEKERWEQIKKRLYGKKCTAQTEWGIIDFRPESVNEIVGGKRLTYDEYLNIMRDSGNKRRRYFELYYYNCGGYIGCKGQIEKKSKGNICFKRIHITGMYDDGTIVEGKEEHVWMQDKGFEKYEKGECLSFSAEIYRYLKIGKGKAIDYALRNPFNISEIDSYELPTEEELLMQDIEQIICEVCMYKEQCYGSMCIANSEWHDNMRKSLWEEMNYLMHK